MSDEWQEYFKDTRRICKYRTKCYQKNPEHHNEFKHPPAQFKGKADKNKNKNPTRYSPYSRNEKANKDHTDKIDDAKGCSSKLTEANISNKEEAVPNKNNLSESNISNKEEAVPNKNNLSEANISNKEEAIPNKNNLSEANISNKEEAVPNKNNLSEANISTKEEGIPDKTPLVDDNNFIKITIGESTQYFDKDSDPEIFKQSFLVDMPSDFFKFYECLKAEGSVEKLLSTVNLQLIGPYDLLLGRLPIIDDKDLYLIHWRFFYDPPEFQAVLKKKGKSEYHIGYFRDSPTEEPVFLAENNSEKGCAIKPIASNIFGAVYWYLQSEKKTSPFASVACQKLIEKINIWAKEHNYSLEEFNMKRRQSQTVCKSFHGAGIVVPYNKKTQLGYRSLAESDAKIRTLFKQLADATSNEEKDKVLSELQPVMTYAIIAVDECDFGTGLEAGIAMFCSGQKELESKALSLLTAVYPLLNREAFGKIIQVHMKYRRRGSDMSIISS